MVKRAAITQLLASKYKLGLPGEEELRAKLDRERVWLVECRLFGMGRGIDST